MSDVGMDDNGQVPVPPQQSASGPGSLLAERRQALGWTIEQVANQLNLAPRQVQAMEDDNYVALPGMVIARGFVRSYAKLLKLDPAPLLALITEKDAPSPESLELRRTLSATFTESSLPPVKRPDGHGKWLAVVLLLLAIGGSGWLAWHEGWLDQLQLPEGLSIPGREVRSASQGAADAGSGVPMGQAEEDVPAASAEPVASQSPAQAPIQTQVAPPAASSAPVASATGPAAPAPNTASTPATAAAGGSASAAKSGEKLVLKAREASWIELKREDGSAVASRLVPAGATESFDVEPGARLVVGNAGGVDVTYRGQVVNLTADAKNNVARLKLK
ncbi:cytoskeleton protein RodZ [Paucimonas lemoignei]|uniref:Cytoskeleton protein RodZ n=1 Tax=Paucimonas lemoignei TaxID=29443 RepID=A0A4R3HS19_PAULE|nr:helix-turn-helix domain-containing protein [Paucimonas lemoignei]TCS33285.1 cytoskeleton protein RodZ [Paucimonas lemoignei]